MMRKGLSSSADVRAAVNLFQDDCRRRYGRRVIKIPLHTGNVCPNRARGGCIYCSAASYTPYYLEPEDPIELQLEKGRALLSRQDADRYFAYFQQETSTYGEEEELLGAFEVPLGDPECVGLIVSTRPDCVHHALFEKLARRVGERELLVELGLQSVHSRSLKFLNRNHSAADFFAALQTLRDVGSVRVGVHLILGLPGENEAQIEQSVARVVAAGVDYLKLHHLLVLKDTPLASLYEREPFALPTPAEHIARLVRLMPQIPKRVVLHRLWSRSRPGFLVAPVWSCSNFDLYDQFFSELGAKGVHQGDAL